MPRHADVLVVGLGATGSAALLALARRGTRVIGVDRFQPPHALGSSHGRSRIIRQAYAESPVYVPLVRDAWERWEALEHDAGRPLLQRTGGLMLGGGTSALVAGAEASARQHALPHERLGAPEIRRRFPTFRIEDGTEALHEPMAGILDPEACITSALILARGAGATIVTGAPVTGLSREGSGFRCATPAGTLVAGQVILAAGAWLPELLGPKLPLVVERQVMHWFRPRDALAWEAGHAPVFIWEWEPGRLVYGIPDQGDGVKVARHHEGTLVEPAGVDRRVSPADRDAIREIVGRLLPTLDPSPSDSVVCLYSNTPDQHFVLGPVPGEPGLLVASACSGHGFKFASALGEVLADLALAGRSAFDLRPFSPARFVP